MIKIFDTTLRDGEQSPGFSMNLREKLIMAQQLEKLGVDVIEAGFSAASPEDFESVKQIGEVCDKAEICGLARCNEMDIESTIKALKTAKKPRVHVFIATSDIHLKHKLKISRDEAIMKAIMAVRMAKSFTDMVDFSPEDATRSDWNFLVEILNEAVKAGADTLNIPDTVGYSTPEEYGALIKFLREKVKGSEKVIFSTHCHDDLGLAVANSLAGVSNGACQVECTINGIGERAGNAALEEVVMAMKTRSDLFKEKNHIDTRQLYATSKLLSQITGQKLQANKAIVGKNAFAHEAGIHQHGILSNRLTYEIMKAEDVGRTTNQLILGKHSGRNALATRLVQLGIQVSKERLEIIFAKFKALADKKKNIYDEDLIMVAMDYDIEKKYELLEARIYSEKDKFAKAEAVIRIGDEKVNVECEGDGPVSALYAAIIQASGLKGELKSFQINALTPDKEAVGFVKIEWQDQYEKIWYGHGSDTDITIASGKALIDVLNRMEIRRMHDERIGRL
ncbi:2-isopropylmalate synthase [Candidatus Peregrinibacteria bacterium]|nr:2-isopropylmalate synthase [Candidatus Peregrinibacteria bacterium]